MSTAFSMPAEWAPHRAVWTAWPYLESEWGDALEGARTEVAALCEAISGPGGEKVKLLVRAADEAAVDRMLGNKVERYAMKYGDIWTRDTAPVFVRNREGKQRAALFRFNGWGQKYVMEGDEKVARLIAGAARVLIDEWPMVLEGGAIDADGEGTLLTTLDCVLGANRNPGLARRAAEQLLSDALGVERVLWLEGCLANDHTDGHVDTLARFVRPGVVACMEARTDDDPNRDTLAKIMSSLGALRDARGRRLDMMVTPSPGRILSGSGEVMAASYMNFYIANRAVLVPMYESRWDDEALARIGELFPGRTAIGLPARSILHGGGAFHCITQQEPA